MSLQFQKKPLKKGGNTWLAVMFAMIAVMGLLSILSPSPKAANPDNDTPAISSQGTYSGYLFKVVSVTLTMVGVLIIGIWLYKKQLKLKGGDTIGLKILAKHYINDKQYLLKVYVEDRYMLLGVSDSSINFITELDDENDEDNETSFGSILDLETNKESKI